VVLAGLVPLGVVGVGLAHDLRPPHAGPAGEARGSPGKAGAAAAPPLGWGAGKHAAPCFLQPARHQARAAV
jgi:hypothetical protein